LCAVSSKHLIRIRARQIFNPAAFGIFLCIILFGAQTQWKGTFLWYIVVPCGLYFVYRIRKFELLFSYATTALALFALQAMRQKVPLSNIFGYLSYFYIFVMLIEPKTTPIKPIGKIIFGASAAVLIFILTEAAVKFDAELAALLTLNLFVPLLNKLP
jgi:Na+-translocating ferredoxin:NAD+ oxidoreductase RnfD subunit